MTGERITLRQLTERIEAEQASNEIRRALERLSGDSRSVTIKGERK